MTDQPFELYLHDIHDLPLLSYDEERRLVALLETAREAGLRLETEAHLSAAERTALQQAVAAGDEARERLVAAHLRLVVRVARQYTSRGVSLLDLIQEGNLALVQAADHFDPGHRVRFATYALWWIRHAIGRAVAEAGQPIHLPEAVRAKLYQLYRARNQLLQQLEREPNELDLAQLTGLAPQEVGELHPLLQPVLSLDAPLNEDSTGELADVVPDPVAELQLSDALQSELAGELKELLHCLTREEREVVALRFGLHNQPMRSRQDVAGILHLSTERVQRLEARALRKLRDPELVRRLREFMD